jgi:hypothetical protein
MSTKGIYIYGIVPNFYSQDMFRSLESLGVYAISTQNIAAIVSDRESINLNYFDRESLGHLLVHHQKTIEELQHKEFNMIIPMRLGMIVSSKEDVIRILTKGHKLIIDTFHKLENLIEIDLVATWADFPGIIKEIANLQEIVDIKHKIEQSGITLTQADQVKVGMLMKEKMEVKNKAVELSILDILHKNSLDIITHETMNDQMITNSAVLLNRNNIEKFEEAIDQLDEMHKGLLNFKMIGPLPCYSFYTLDAQELNPLHISKAKEELELPDETSESKIKKAYLERAKLFHPDTDQKKGDEANFNRINKAYHTLLDYSAAVKQTSKEISISLAKENVIENLILVKIKK